MNRRQYLGLFHASFLLAANLIGQQPGSPPELKPHPEPSAGRSVLLDVVVLSKPAHPLQSSDFTLFDNRKQVSSTSLHLVTGTDSAQQTRQLLFIIDAINSPLADVSRTEDALESFLTATPRLPQPTSILIVSDSEPRDGSSSSTTTTLHPHQLFVHRIPPETDASALLQALRSYKPGLHRILESQAGPGQAERVRLSLEALSFVANALQPLSGAKSVVWISPGWPYLQDRSAPPNAQLFNSIVYFSDLLRMSRIILYAASPSGSTSGQFPVDTFTPRDPSNFANIAPPRVPIHISDTYYESFLKAPRTAAESNPNDLALQVLAIQSGGLVLQHNNNLTSLISRCASEVETLYTLSYTLSEGTGFDRFHELALKASSPVRSRTGLYLR